VTQRTCTVEDCDRPHIARGFCTRHYRRWQKYGDPLGAHEWPLRTLLQNAATLTGPGPCEEYFGTKNRPAYRIDGRAMPASRAVWIIAYGDPGTWHVLHDCGNDRCLRVGHLYLGTHEQNMHDCVRHGVSTAGERHPNAKLTDAKVLEIRALRGVQPASVVASNYGVGDGTIYMIWRDQAWKHLLSTSDT